MSVPYSKRNHTKISINYRDITTSFPLLSYSNLVFTISLITQQPLRVTKAKVYCLKAIFNLYNSIKKVIHSTVMVMGIGSSFVYYFHKTIPRFFRYYIYKCILFCSLSTILRLIWVQILYSSFYITFDIYVYILL